MSGTKPLPRGITNTVPSPVNDNVRMHTVSHRHNTNPSAPHETTYEPWSTVVSQSRNNLCWLDAVEAAIGGGPFLCRCVFDYTKAGCFGSFHLCMLAYHKMKKICQCGHTAKENEGEAYDLRKVTFLQKNKKKAFLDGFPMHTRGVFLVVVNHVHCVVFDASR
jgi:hypothetical protein